MNYEGGLESLNYQGKRRKALIPKIIAGILIVLIIVILIYFLVGKSTKKDNTPSSSSDIVESYRIIDSDGITAKEIVQYIPFSKATTIYNAAETSIYRNTTVTSDQLLDDLKYSTVFNYLFNTNNTIATMDCATYNKAVLPYGLCTNGDTGYAFNQNIKIETISGVDYASFTKTYNRIFNSNIETLRNFDENSFHCSLYNNNAEYICFKITLTAKDKNSIKVSSVKEIRKFNDKVELDEYVIFVNEINDQVNIYLPTDTKNPVVTSLSLESVTNEDGSYSYEKIIKNYSGIVPYYTNTFGISEDGSYYWKSIAPNNTDNNITSSEESSSISSDVVSSNEVSSSSFVPTSSVSNN